LSASSEEENTSYSKKYPTGLPERSVRTEADLQAELRAIKRPRTISTNGDVNIGLPQPQVSSAFDLMGTLADAAEEVEYIKFPFASNAGGWTVDPDGSWVPN
jgi:hypothetical protein